MKDGFYAGELLSPEEETLVSTFAEDGMPELCDAQLKDLVWYRLRDARSRDLAVERMRAWLAASQQKITKLEDERIAPDMRVIIFGGQYSVLDFDDSGEQLMVRLRGDSKIVTVELADLMKCGWRVHPTEKARSEAEHTAAQVNWLKHQEVVEAGLLDDLELDYADGFKRKFGVASGAV